MAYLEVIRRNGKIYYCATKNFRIGKNKWRKIRKFLGDEKPDKIVLEGAFREIETEALEKGFNPKGRFAYLAEADAERLEDVKDAFKKWFGKLSFEERSKYESDFLVRFTYNTNAIEGNRLSLRETSMILTESIIPSGASVNDYNEALNSRDAFEFAKNYVGELNQRFLLKLHERLTKNTGCRIVGAYRDSQVRISGSEWTPPAAKEVPLQMKKFFQWYNNYKNKLHPLELGSVAHCKLVQIHPFADGNGRTARLVLNWMLLRRSYPMFYVEAKDKIHYYEAIEEADKGKYEKFVEYVAKRLAEEFTFVSKNDDDNTSTKI